MSISDKAMLVDLRISVWTARKKDKNTEAKVVKDNNALSAKAASVNKHLMADAEALAAVGRFAGECRQWLYLNTLPWSDSGARLLPTSGFFTFKTELTKREQNFWQLVTNFEREYPALITQMALQLGSLFNRNEYPAPDVIHEKFGFAPEFSPVPDAGDFRVSVSADALDELRAEYEAASQRKLEKAIKTAWETLHETAEHMVDKLQPVKEGEPTKRIHETMLTNALQVCKALKHLNITNDAALEDARRNLERIVEAVDTKSLREVPELRETVRSQLSVVLDKFSI